MASTSPEEPLQRVIEYVIQHLGDAIEAGECSLTPRSLALRNAFVRILNSLPIANKVLLSAATSYAAYEYTLFYERVRLGMSRLYFLDGVPLSVQLFAGPTSISLPDSDVQKLKLRDLLADRLRIVCKLEGMNATNPRKRELVAQHTAGLSNQVPGPARVLVARCRAMFQSARRLRPERCFAQCANCNCGRLFYVGESAEYWALVGNPPNPPRRTTAPTAGAGAGADDGDDDDGGGGGSGTEDNDDATDGDTKNYWALAEAECIKDNNQPDQDDPDPRRFCSDACAAQHAAHLLEIMPETEQKLDIDDFDARRPGGRSRVPEAFKLALQRNQIAARELRLVRQVSRPNQAVSRLEVEAKLSRRVTALNVDIGVLYASALIAESVNLSRGKTLPGSFEGWRCDPVYYSRVLANVCKIYRKYRRTHGVISQLLTMPLFLQKLKEKVAYLF